MSELYPAILILLLCGVAVGGARAQSESQPQPAPEPEPIRFDHLTSEDGLSDMRVTSIWQDRQGFMWFGTWNGLNRYDGYTSTVYRHDPLDSTSLSSSYVEEIIEDSRGNLWIGTIDAGLNRYDPATDSFVRYRHDPSDSTTLCADGVASLYESRDGTIWVSGGGALGRYERSSNSFACYRHNPSDANGLSGPPGFAIYEDRRGVLWVGSGNPYGRADPKVGGLSRFDPKTETFTSYKHDANDPGSLINNHVMALYEDSRGTFWVGTWGDGLHSMDRERGVFTRHRYDPEHPDRLSGPHLGEEGLNGITFIHEDLSRRLWIGGSGGIVLYDPETGAVSRFEQDPGNASGFNTYYVWEIYEDQTGIIWIGCGGAGCLMKVDPAAGFFRHFEPDPNDTGEFRWNQAYAVHQGRSGIVWIGTDTELNMLDQETGTITRVQENPAATTSGLIWAIWEDREGALWMGGSRGGLRRLDRLTGTLTTYVHDPEDPSSIGGGAVRVIFEDRQGVLWVGTNGGGLNRFDRATGTFTRFQHDTANPSSLRSNDVTAIYEDRAGVLWVGTFYGGALHRFDRDRGTFTSYLEGVSVNSMFEDASGRFWIGTDREGLHLFDRETGSSSPYTTQDGLPSNAIMGILEDVSGRLWLSTGKGLSRFEPVAGTFRNYDASDGLKIRFFSSLGQGAQKLTSGAFLFAGTGGVVSFSPDRFQSDPDPPSVSLTALKLFNETVRPGAHSPLQRPFSTTESIILSHSENDLTFDYVGLHYGNPAGNRYRVMLDGYETEWLEAGTQRATRYTNLSPGEYAFRVKAANPDGVWSQEKALQITILPPWWRTWWAYTLYGMLVACGVFVVDRFQRRRLVRRERDRARERELEQAREIERAYEELKRTQAQLIQQEKLASLGQLTAGIAHEIKNPLNFINNFAGLSKELSAELRQAAAEGNLDEIRAIVEDLDLNACKIEEHGRRADGIVRGMLEHSRGTNGTSQDADVNALVEEYVKLAWHGVRAQFPGFEVTIERHYDEAIGEVELVPQEIGRVLINLLNNAFYAVHEKTAKVDGQYEPAVSIVTDDLGESVEIRVRDNGPGMSEPIRRRIFEPFFTTKPTGSGTGLGLSLAYDIVTQGHGGSLSVVSEEGEGATFVMTLPK